MNRIQELREAKGMTQQQLADAVGVNQSTITRYETGKLKIENIHIVLRLISVLGCTMGDIIGQDSA